MADTADIAPNFIADCHYGKLAKYLRFMGYDTRYFPAIADEELVALARQERRTILTHDRELALRKNVHVYYLKAETTDAQLRELAQLFSLRLHDDDQRRCLRCNRLLEQVDPQTLSDKVPIQVLKTFAVFRRCPECGRIYWNGDHYRNMHSFIETALGGQV